MDTSYMNTYTDPRPYLALLRRYAVQLPARNTPAIAYSYLRFSSLPQADGDSVRRQNMLRDEWLKNNPHVKLDRTLVLEDRGVSGYTGENRTDPKHALACFLDEVARHRVPVGSYLIVENLDRLTRENPIVSIPSVLGIIAAGIRVVQLAPYQIVYDSEMEQHHLMTLLWELSRGHGESKRKSTILGPAWAEKKAQARQSKTPYGAQMPEWLELVDGKYRIKNGADEAIREIFKLSATGWGHTRILRHLMMEEVPAFGRSGGWTRSYIASILRNRAVIGEYQPHVGHKIRLPDGEPIPDYYPAVLSEEEFAIVHLAKKLRCGRSGRPPGKASAFAFSGMLRCALDRCPMHISAKTKVRQVVSQAAAEGRPGSNWRTFPADVLQQAILSQMRELAAEDLFEDGSGAKVKEIEGKLAAVESRLTVALARFEDDPESPVWADRVSEYDRQKRRLVAELAEAKQEAASPLPAAWETAVAQIEANQSDRLRTALLATVEAIWCLVVVRGWGRFLVAQVHFRGGSRRDYLLHYSPPRPGGVAAVWWARSLAEACGLDIDLREADDVRALEDVLGKIEVPDVKSP